MRSILSQIIILLHRSSRSRAFIFSSKSSQLDRLRAKKAGGIRKDADFLLCVGLRSSDSGLVQFRDGERSEQKLRNKPNTRIKPSRNCINAVYGRVTERRESFRGCYSGIVQAD